ncbi:unnamed protein product [Pylaiella littoralis]
MKKMRRGSRVAGAVFASVVVLAVVTALGVLTGRLDPGLRLSSGGKDLAEDTSEKNASSGVVAGVGAGVGLVGGATEGGGGGDGATRVSAPRWTGGGKRAYAVAFPDVGDPLALEQARALWNTLGAFKERGEDVVAMVPRYTGQHLEAPLEAIGYRVIARDSPAPLWRTSGRWVAQALTMISAGFAAGGAGGGGRGGHGWHLLALEALALVEYEEVVVLDQKTVIFSREMKGNGGGGRGRPRRHQRRRGSAEEGGEVGGGEGVEQQHAEAAAAAAAKRATLSSLVPGDDDWTAAFATAGDGSVLPNGPGLDFLAKEQRDLFSRQHPGLMAVRPDAGQYEALSELLCKGDDIIFSAYSDLPTNGPSRERYLQSVVSTIPLMHLAVASLSDSPADGGPAARTLPLEMCGEGGTTQLPWPSSAAAAAQPVVWCPPAPASSQEPHEQRRSHRSLLVVAGRSTGEETGDGSPAATAAAAAAAASIAVGSPSGGLLETPSSRGLGRGRGGGGGGKDGSWFTRRGSAEVEAAELEEAELEEAELEEAGAGGAALGFAWIPGDPCSCVDAPGMVGEACRGWLWARWAESPSRLLETLEEGVQSSSILSVCGGDGRFSSPLQLPPPTRQQAALTATTSGASFASTWRTYLATQGDAGEGARVGTEAGEGSAVVPALPLPSQQQQQQQPPIPPPFWRTRKPEKEAVVTESDRRQFQHFWLASVEKKLLVVAIPKVACTQLHALFLRLLGSEGWDSQILFNIHFHKDQKKYTLGTMEGITAKNATDILNDPSWTKAVFLRDPAERMLSCYLDKIVHRRSYSVNFFKTDGIISFEKFVALTSKGAETRYCTSNPHWKPQFLFGLDKFLPYFDFVGDFQHVQAHSEALLRHAGLWDEFGASGWGPGGKSGFFQRSTVQGHGTGSHDHKAQYLTPPLLSSIIEAYGPTDYRMMAGLGWWNESVGLVG